MKKIRRSFGSVKDPYPEEPPPLDLTKDVADNMRELLSEVTKKELMPTSKRMGYLNNFAQLVRHFPNPSDYGFPLDEIVACLRVALISSAKEVRAAGFRAYRHLLNDDSIFDVFLEQRIDFFICKSLDLPPTQEVERVQALRLVRKMVYICPKRFPLSVAMALASISVDTAHEKDRLSRACLATLCELAVQNVEIASYSGIIGAIITNTLDCSIPRMNESLISTILYLYNHPNFRKYVRRRVGIEPILAPFTDLYYTHSSDLQDSQIKEDRINRLESAKLALVAIIRSWAGLVNFCDPDGDSIVSLLGVFALPNTEVKRAIIDTLFEVFLLRQPEHTDDFSIALQSIDPSSMQDDWKLTDKFMLAEADAVLPHRATSTRANLIENYLSLLLSAFLEAGVLVSLVKVITTSDEFICIRGSILLGEILHLTNVLLPPTHSGQTHCLPLLMSLATDLEKPAMERGKASAVVGYLDQLHKMKKRGSVPNTLVMEHLINQVAKYENQGNKSKSRQEKLDLHYAWREVDEVGAAIREAGMFTVGTQQEFEYQTWNWDLISTILESSKVTEKRGSEDPLLSRFIKRLSTFYKPFQKLYSEVPLDDPMARKYSEVAIQLVDFLLRKDEQPDGEKYLIEILQDIRDCLGEAIQPGRLTGVFSTNNLSETLTRDYFLLIGRLSSTTEGLRILEKTSGIFQYLMEICSMGARESLIKLIISCLDYGRDGMSRVLLSKTLSAAPLTARLYATKFLRVLLRIKCPYFSNWGIEFLTNQLYDQEVEIVETAIEILEEACEDEANLQRLVEVRPHLLHFGEKGIRLLSRYVSVTKGFTYLKEMDYLKPLLQLWKETYNKEYVTWIELEISEALSSYEKQGTQGGYIRRSSSRFIKRKDVYVLPHLFGELGRHRNGIELLEESDLISEAIDVIVQQRIETFEDISELKAALWAVAHVMSSRVGINAVLTYKTNPQAESMDGATTEDESVHEIAVVEQGVDATDKNKSMDEEGVVEEITPLDDSIGAVLIDDEVEDDVEDEPSIINLIVEMASNCEVLSIRGTCFYVLGLIGSTSIGAERLELLGWDSVRHKCSEDWPVMEPDIGYFYEETSDDEEEGNGEHIEEADNSISQFDMTPSQPDLFGGIYVGPEDVAEEFAVDKVHFDYRVEVYGLEDNKKKGKKSKIPVSDESRYFQDIAAMAEREPEPNIKTKFFDIDSRGYMYEKGDDGPLVGLDRLNHNTTKPSMCSVDTTSGIYLGDEPPTPTTTMVEEPSPSSFTEHQGGDTFEDFLPFLSGKIRDQFAIPPSYHSPSVSSQLGKTKALYDDYGIYLGEVPDEDDDTIEANLSPIPLTNHQASASPMPTSEIPLTPPLDYPRAFLIENNEPLKPIREEKSQESLELVKNVLTSVDVNTVNEEQEEDVSLADDTNVRWNYHSLRTISISEDQNTSQSPVNPSDISMEDSRMRSISLTEDGVRTIQETRSPRSASFSGAQQNKTLSTRISMRAGSDPGLGIIPHSLTGSLSSQESDSGSKRNFKKSNNRRKSRSENSDISEHVRSNSILSDYGTTPGTRLRMTKRLRGGSNVSLGVSPKSGRSESPLSRDGAFGYTAWQTLKKQRSFKKELDWNLKRHLAVSDKRRFGRSFASQYRHFMESSDHRRASVPVITRKQLASSSSCDFLDQRYTAPAEDYIGRALPRYLSGFFSIKTYDFVGSWADNFLEFTDANRIQTFDRNFKHVKERCLHCRIQYAHLFVGKERSESDISVRSKSRTSSKEDATCGEEEDSESSGRDTNELSPKMRANIRKDVIRLVVNLSSAVASKNTQQEIIALHGRHSWAFRDLCLYSQVGELLGMFTFRIAIRRFVQKLFEHVDYQVIFESADMTLGRPLVYGDSNKTERF